ncbi:MAG: hypothetical protein IJ877_08490 [Candidatus Gastranaerophilales bacterium]|nr:hypothetical protein [Candidatus Gastranaerophilales bacterium]
MGVDMQEQENCGVELNGNLHEEISKYSESLTLDYCGFRLRALAKKIKSECMKLKKQEQKFLNI